MANYKLNLKSFNYNEILAAIPGCCSVKGQALWNMCDQVWGKSSMLKVCSQVKVCFVAQYNISDLSLK